MRFADDFEALPPEARIGWWVFEWYWNQADIAGLDRFVADIRKLSQKVPTARTWFGYVATHTIGLIANQERTLDSMKLARALALVSEIALQPRQLMYRRSDHQLMSPPLVGKAKSSGIDPEDLFEIVDVVAAEKVAPQNTGCALHWPT